MNIVTENINPQINHIASSYSNLNTTSRVQVIPARETTTNSFKTNEVVKKRVCAYCRVSTEEESQATSYELQVSYYTDFIKKNQGWEFKGVYADEGISGTSTKNRTEFMKMIQDCMEGGIDYIITKSISRFARNTLDCLKYIRQLKNLPNPVGVFFEKENLDTLDGKSELFLTILSSLAQDESRSISENSKWGVEKRFQQGRAHCPTKYFLGYDTDENGKLVINEEEAKIIRLIYREFLSGKGTNTIAKKLMKEGLLTARGNSKWTPDAVFKILKNEKYCGDILMQKTVTLDFLTHKRVRNKNHQPQYFVEDHHDAIIDKKDWYAVQEELKRRNQMLRDPENKYRQSYSGRCAFSNKFFCAECGRPVTRRRLTSSKKGKKYHFSAWQCRVAAGHDKEFKGCNSRYIWENSLEEAFMKMLYEIKGNEDEIVYEARQAIKAYELNELENERLIEVEEQIMAINNRIKEVSAGALGQNNDIYETVINQLNYEKSILQTELENLMNKKQKSIAMERQLQVLLEALDGLEELQLESGEEDDLNAEDKKNFRDDIFLLIIERGLMHRDGRVDFEFKCGITKRVQAFMRASCKK